MLVLHSSYSDGAATVSTLNRREMTEIKKLHKVGLQRQAIKRGTRTQYSQIDFTPNLGGL
jgi:hypothetical protein